MVGYSVTPRWNFCARISPSKSSRAILRNVVPLAAVACSPISVIMPTSKVAPAARPTNFPTVAFSLPSARGASSTVACEP